METLGILIGPKGRGTNMRALVESCEAGRCGASVALVVSPLPDTPGAEFARQRNVPVAVVEPGDGYADRLLEALRPATVVCLAGFTRLLPAEVLSAYPDRVLNIHPALLPKFGGKGMYGMRVHEAVLAAGEAESGCTVHLVDERYDEGRIILQARCPVLPGDTPESLAARVLELEHRAYPEAVRRLVHGAPA